MKVGMKSERIQVIHSLNVFRVQGKKKKKTSSIQRKELEIFPTSRIAWTVTLEVPPIQFSSVQSLSHVQLFVTP